MLLAAGLLALALGALAVAAPPRLAAAAWPLRAPLIAVVLWQSLGLAGGLLALELAATLALAPYGGTHAAAVGALVAGAPAPHGAALVGAVAAALAGLLVLARLVQVLGRSVVRTLRERREHRRLVDLVATCNPLVHGVRVLEHELPVAYCLPGLRPRVVLSQGTLLRLSGPEVEAVLAHEQAHLARRHDLVVLPFVALDATFPRLPGVRTAVDEVALLVEMLADDDAALTHDRTTLARALYKVGQAPAPVGGLAAGERGVLVRAGRLLSPPPPLPRAQTAAALAAAVVVAALPALGLLAPLL